MTAQEHLGPPEPADALWSSISETNLSLVDGEYLIGCAEARLGYPLSGQIRTDLLSLAEGEVAYYKGQSSGYKTVDFDEYWDEVTFDEAMHEARTEISEHQVEIATEDAMFKIELEGTDLMQYNYMARKIARLVAEQCLGIKPIFGKGVNDGNSN